MIETSAPTMVVTREGAVRGAVTDGVHTFRGIPYASPPFAANHLRAPQPVEPWTGVRDAIVDGAKPPQPPFPGTENAPAPWDRAPVGEDCLNLTIWTPDPGKVGLPVMVWITGGSFRAGSNAWYDGSRFARDGVVCVAINYRSGPEGFLYLRDGTANRGLLDQIAAMEWVRENIAAFGGDPDSVTVCGESAGAMSIGMLLAVPRAAGLFRRAILQSGAADRVVPANTARRIGERFAEKLGVAPTQAAMAAVSWDRLIAAHAALDADVMANPDPEFWGLSMAGAMLTQPVIDGDVIPSAPLECIRAGSAAGVDVLVGTNVDDWRMFLAFTGAIGQITDQMLSGPVKQYGSQTFAAYGLPVEGGAGRLSRRVSGGQPGRAPGGDPDGLVVPHPGTPSRRCARQPHLEHVHVRVRLALAGRQRHVRGMPRSRDPVRLRHARPRPGPDDRRAPRRRPAAAPRGHDALRVGLVHHSGRPRVASLRPQPAGDDAVRL